MNLDDYLKSAGELADALAVADGAAENASTLDKAIDAAETWESDDWVPWALELVPIPKNPTNNSARVEKTKLRLHKATALWLEQNGHKPYTRQRTEQNIAAGQAARLIPESNRVAFRTEKQVRPLTRLMKLGLHASIPEAVDIATAGGTMTPTFDRVKAAVVDVEHRKLPGGGSRYTPIADAVTQSAEWKAEEAFRKLIKAAGKSANGAEQVNKYIQFIKDETRQFRRASAA